MLNIPLILSGIFTASVGGVITLAPTLGIIFLSLTKAKLHPKVAVIFMSMSVIIGAMLEALGLGVILINLCVLLL